MLVRSVNYNTMPGQVYFGDKTGRVVSGRKKEAAGKDTTAAPPESPKKTRQPSKATLEKHFMAQLKTLSPGAVIEKMVEVRLLDASQAEKIRQILFNNNAVVLDVHPQAVAHVEAAARLDWQQRARESERNFYAEHGETPDQYWFRVGR